MIDLWNPTHVSLGIDLLTAFILGVVHGATPDEHTWPITFSYAIGSYSTRRGLCAGLTFSLAFTLQRAIASELAYLGLARIFAIDWLNGVISIVVGLVMVWAGVVISNRGRFPHLRLLRARDGTGARGIPSSGANLADPRPWMPAVHGFIAGWGFGAFAAILYTVLAPAMPSAAFGWAPGAAFGLGTTVMQMMAGAAFGYWASRSGMDALAIRRIGLTTAARTLFWGGMLFVMAGGFDLLFPRVAEIGIESGLKVHNLHSIGLPFLLVIFIVVGIGVTTLRREVRRARNSRVSVVNSN